MGEEPKKHLTRRQALAAAGTLGAGAALAGAIALGTFNGEDGGESGETVNAEPTGESAATSAAGGLPAACVLTPSLTEGPFFVDGQLDRRDVRGGQPGVPLELEISVVNADEDCVPYPGAAVDIWQCNAQGVYSDVSAPASDAVEGSWLRGLQRTGPGGKVNFTTIYPGWYPGRTVHIHLKVRTFRGGSVTYNFTSQLFFPEELNDEVMATVPAYMRSEPMTTTNSNDGIFSPDLVLDLSGNEGDGYSGAIEIGLTGLPA